MGNCLSKFNDEYFTLHTLPSPQDILKKWQVVSERTL